MPPLLTNNEVRWETGPNLVRWEFSPPVRGSAAWARPHTVNNVVVYTSLGAQQKGMYAHVCSRGVYVYEIVFGRPGCLR